MWLVGMMGSGKTTVGEKAAARIGVRFFDTDRIIVETAGKPIARIWEDIGEDGFRGLERKAVSSVPVTGCLAAAGGGAVLAAENREHIERGSPVVWLRGSVASLTERLRDAGDRPLLDHDSSLTERLEEILAGRTHLYEEIATEVIATDDLSIDEVVDEVVGIWESS